MANSIPTAQTPITDPDQWDSDPFDNARVALTHHSLRTEQCGNDIITQLRRLHVSNVSNEDGRSLSKTKVIRSLLEEDAALMNDPNWPTFFLFPVPRWSNRIKFDVDHARAILHDRVLGFRLGYAVQTLVSLREKNKRCPILEEGADPQRKKEIWQCLSLFDYVLRLQGMERVMLDPDHQNPALELCSEAIKAWFDARRAEREPEVKAFFHPDYEAEEEDKEDWQIGETPFYKGMVAAQKHHTTYFTMG